MIDINQYMKNVGITKKDYVQEWISLDLIPGVQKNENGTYMFPASARRPYRTQCNSKGNANAKVIRGAMVNACLKRQHISAATFRLSEKEFEGYISDLIAAGLIKERREDGIAYYDSTLKSEQFNAKNTKALANAVNKYITAIEPAVSLLASALTIKATGI